MATSLRANGIRSRIAILDRGLELTSRGGLHTATIGALSGLLGMSKSGVFAQFGSKESLDLALIDTAAGRFAAAVVAPATFAPPGIAKVAALCEGFLAFVSQPLASGPSLTPDHPSFGPGAAPAAQARLDLWRLTWREALASSVTDAVARGELAAQNEPAQVVFELQAVLEAAARAVQHQGVEGIATRTRRAIDRVLLA